MTIRRGTWSAGYPPGVHQILLVLLTCELILRGMDYFTGDHSEATNNLLTIVERAMPLTWWGLLCLASAALTITGIIGRWANLIVAGALLASGIYGGLAWGMLLRMFEYGCRPAAETTPGYALVWGGVTAALLSGAWFGETRRRTVVLLLLGVATGTWTAIILTGATDNLCAWDGYRRPATMAAMGILWHVIAYGTHLRAQAHKVVMGVARE